MSPKKTQDSSNAFKQKKTGIDSFAGKIPLILILLLVVVAFVAAPLFTRVGNSSGGNLVFGSYGDKKIEYSQGNYFYSQVNLLNNMYRDQISQSEDLFDYYRYYIWSSAYQQSLTYAAKTYELEKSGYTLSDKGLSRLIIQSGYYNGEDGSFDETAYAEATSAQREEIRESILTQSYLTRFNNDRLGGIYKSEDEITSLINTSPEEKQFRYVYFSSSQYPESELLAYGENHKDLFTSYPLSRITVASKADGEKAIKEMAEGDKNFAEAAAAYSTDMYSTAGGVMGDIYRYSLIDELGEEKADTVLSLGIGDFSEEPIETDYGWYIYNRTGDSKAPDFTDEALLSSVRNWMSWNEASAIDTWVMGEAEAFASSVSPSEENGFVLEAVKKGYEVKTTDYFPLNWGSSPIVGSGLNGADDSVIQGAALSDDFFTAAFSLENAGEISSPIIMDSGILVLQLIDSRDSESMISEYSCMNYLQKNQEELYSKIVSDSPLYEDHFSETYYKLFPPESTEES